MGKRMGKGKNSFYARYSKRFFDVVLSLLALVIVSPVMAVTAVLVKIKLGSPVLFCQERLGKEEKIFKMYKFRTMTEKRDQEGKLLPDEERLTEFGKKLRSSSLDELPELINILKGEMSIVGPRPLLVEYLPLYNQEQRKRHEVSPGLTGLAQVNGRNAITWEEKFQYDLEYIKRMSIRVDIVIIYQTIKKVWEREGIYAGQTSTIEPFQGNEKKDFFK